METRAEKLKELERLTKAAQDAADRMWKALPGAYAGSIVLIAGVAFILHEDSILIARAFGIVALLVGLQGVMPWVRAGEDCDKTKSQLTTLRYWFEADGDKRSGVTRAAPWWERA